MKKPILSSELSYLYSYYVNYELPPPKGGGFLLTQKSRKVFEFGQFLPEFDP
jgi:hypothetical protein